MVSAIKDKNNKMGLCRNMAGYAWPWKTHKMTLSKIQKEGLYDIKIENKYEVIMRISTFGILPRKTG